MKVKRISEAGAVRCSKVLAVHLRQMTQENHEKLRIVLPTTNYKTHSKIIFGLTSLFLPLPMSFSPLRRKRRQWPSLVYCESYVLQGVFVCLFVLFL
jgi:hypothetical protein